MKYVEFVMWNEINMYMLLSRGELDVACINVSLTLLNNSGCLHISIQISNIEESRKKN